MQLATSQSWFEDIGGICRPFGFAYSNNGVELINKQNVFALGFGNFLQNCFESFFKLPAKSRAGH